MEPLGQQPPGGVTSHNQGLRGMQDLQDDNQTPKARVSFSTPSYPIPEVSNFVATLLGMLVPVVVIVLVVVRECVSKRRRR